MWIGRKLRKLRKLKRFEIGLLLADCLVNIDAREMRFSWFENAPCSPVPVTGRRTSHESKSFLVSRTWKHLAGHTDLDSCC
jgi:hypothetical protein